MANAVRETYATKVRNINNGIVAVDKVYKKISRARTQSKDSIRNALKDATSESNIKTLQNAMSSYRISNGILKQFINYQSNILTNDYFLVPTDMTKFKNKEDMWKKRIRSCEIFGIIQCKEKFPLDV